MSPAFNRLRVLLQIWMILFLGATVVFLFFGNDLLSKINQLSARLFPSLPLVAVPQEKFWLTLSLSLMITLVFLCGWAQKDVAKNLAVVPVLLVSKFTSTFFYFIFFLVHERTLAYFVGLMTDGAIFLITWIFYGRAQKEIKVRA
ncbi:MAG: hypothetical protein HYU99_05510 [Deltaproteobacteria bacterium]|nr:hypothetical protein [Deltaproteobacteria bacterium]